MKITRDDLAQQLADRLTEAMDLDSILDAFWTSQYEFYLKEAPNEMLYSDAENLGLIESEEELEILD